MSMLEVPDWPTIGDLMSNFDHLVEEPIARQLRDENVVANYPGGEFFAYCWFADGQFHAAVWCHNAHRDTISADTPEQLMTAVCAVYGDE